MSVFKLRGVGVDTSTIKQVPTQTDIKPDYVFTSISANNDYLLDKYLLKESESDQRTKIYTYISFNIRFEEYIKYHLEFLKSDYIDVAFFDVSADWSWLKDKQESLKDIIKGYGIYMPKSVEEIENIINTFGSKVSSIAISCSPLDYNYEIMTWCRENNVEVSGFNPIGGYISAPRNIESFTLQYLLNFAAYHCDLVFLSGRNLREVSRSILYYYENFLGLQEGEEDSNKSDLSSLYGMNKSMHRDVAPLKKLINTSINVAEVGLDCFIKYDDPNFILSLDSIKLFLGKAKTVIPPTETIEDVDEDLTKYLNSVDLGKNINDPMEKAVIIRYKSLEYIKSTYKSEDNWKYKCATLGESILTYSLHRPASRVGKRFWQRATPEINLNILIVITSEKILAINANIQQ